MSASRFREGASSSDDDEDDSSEEGGGGAFFFFFGGGLDGRGAFFLFCFGGGLGAAATVDVSTKCPGAFVGSAGEACTGGGPARGSASARRRRTKRPGRSVSSTRSSYSTLHLKRLDVAPATSWTVPDHQRIAGSLETGRPSTLPSP